MMQYYQKGLILFTFFIKIITVDQYLASGSKSKEAIRGGFEKGRVFKIFLEAVFN
jgi:hypothetical protein